MNAALRKRLVEGNTGRWSERWGKELTAMSSAVQDRGKAQTEVGKIHNVLVMRVRAAYHVK
jgi:hypothetical protein